MQSDALYMACYPAHLQVRSPHTRGKVFLQAADEERASQGRAKKQESDEEAMKHLTLGKSFLGLFRKENETEQPSQLEASKRPWSLPMPFWKSS